MARRGFHTHGHSRIGYTPQNPRGKESPEYRAWRHAKSRCYDPNFPNYARYGGRGITMCEEWRRSFGCFLRDLGDRPSVKHSLDRIDSNGNYEPGNCRWATVEDQNNNRRSNNLFELNGQLKSATQWARHFSVPVPLVRNRLQYGWSLEDALHKPKQLRSSAARANTRQ